MATNLDIDDRIIVEAQVLGKHKSKKDAVTAALLEYIQHRRQQEVLTFAGKVEFHPDFDHKKLRRKR
ncbi:MAG: type II toxin-antitoxin system VapB family antitoxin [Planctomycetes bacterium]|nr:type II toxin-antitoxin system VapB family antitoxin [Planctomycetota bacterium]